jgi:hypothetical protein
LSAEEEGREGCRQLEGGKFLGEALLNQRLRTLMLTGLDNGQCRDLHLMAQVLRVATLQQICDRLQGATGVGKSFPD